MDKEQCVVSDEMFNRLNERTTEFLNSVGWGKPDFSLVDEHLLPVVKLFKDLPGVTTVFGCQGHPEQGDFEYQIIFAVSDIGYPVFCSFIKQLRLLNLEDESGGHHLKISLWSGTDPEASMGDMMTGQATYNAIELTRRVVDRNDIIATKELIIKALSKIPVANSRVDDTSGQSEQGYPPGYTPISFRGQDGRGIAELNQLLDTFEDIGWFVLYGNGGIPTNPPIVNMSIKTTAVDRFIEKLRALPNSRVMIQTLRKFPLRVNTLEIDPTKE